MYRCVALPIRNSANCTEPKGELEVIRTVDDTYNLFLGHRLQRPSSKAHRYGNPCRQYHEARDRTIRLGVAQTSAFAYLVAPKSRPEVPP